MTVLRFDSKLVRLKDESAYLVDRFEKSFDSKLVRLKVFFCRDAFCLKISFDSKLVRLKGYLLFLWGATGRVSIPNWFD